MGWGKGHKQETDEAFQLPLTGMETPVKNTARAKRIQKQIVAKAPDWAVTHDIYSTVVIVKDADILPNRDPDIADWSNLAKMAADVRRILGKKHG